MGRHDLNRFLDAQAGGAYERALGEVSCGRKESHWIWFVFPQLKGLGMSEASEFYGIESIGEAREYLAHPVLGRRLREISEALLGQSEGDPERIFGWPDVLKVRSCMALFDLLEPGKAFAEILDRFYGGERDGRTLELLKDGGGNVRRRLEH